MPLPSQARMFDISLIAYGALEEAPKASRFLAEAMAAGDILKALTENGAGQRIIAARDEELEATCATAHRIFWLWCTGLFLAQACIATALATLLPAFRSSNPLVIA